MPSLPDILRFTVLMAVLVAGIFFVTSRSKKTQTRLALVLFGLFGVIYLASGIYRYLHADFGPIPGGRDKQPVYFYQEIAVGGIAIAGAICAALKSRKGPPPESTPDSDA